jgi:hypothetical protein
MPEEHQEGLQALDQIQTILTEEGETRGLPSLGEICDQYKTIRPLAAKAVKLVVLIPLYGPKIAIAMEFLMKVADYACPNAQA